MSGAFCQFLAPHPISVMHLSRDCVVVTGGAGGKGTWGIPGSELVGVEEAAEDPHDPNYDSDSQENCKFEAITPPLNEDEIEKFVTPIIAEYFEHGDTEEVIYALEMLNLDDQEYQVLVVAVSMAMEKKSSHREMTSVMISDFYNRVFFEEDIERAFDILIKLLPDLVLDTPGAPTVLGNFIARAVADDCIPPAYVSRHLEKVAPAAPEDLKKQAISHASALLNMKHGLVKLDSVWGVTGGMRPVKYVILMSSSCIICR
jgi:programmed cell death protein 4